MYKKEKPLQPPRGEKKEREKERGNTIVKGKKGEGRNRTRT